MQPSSLHVRSEFRRSPSFEHISNICQILLEEIRRVHVACRLVSIEHTRMTLAENIDMSSTFRITDFLVTFFQCLCFQSLPLEAGLSEFLP